LIDEVLIDVPWTQEIQYYGFDGEYWNDELEDLRVIIEDKCEGMSRSGKPTGARREARNRSPSIGRGTGEGRRCDTLAPLAIRNACEVIANVVRCRSHVALALPVAPLLPPPDGRGDSWARCSPLRPHFPPCVRLRRPRGKLPGENIVGRADDEDPKAFLKRVKGDLTKVDASIDATKELLSKSKDSPLLPDVELRLAELYVEKSRLLYYKAVEERGNKSGGEAIAAPDSKYFKELAIEQYKRILKDFPAYPQNDKIEFFLGHEYQELVETPEMLAAYGKLADSYPDSPLVPEAPAHPRQLLFREAFVRRRDQVLQAGDRQRRRRPRRARALQARLDRDERRELQVALAEFESAARAADPTSMASTNATG